MQKDTIEDTVIFKKESLAFNETKDVPVKTRKYKSFDAAFKYRIIEELCNGKSVSTVAKENKVNAINVYTWLEIFVRDGAFGTWESSPEEKVRIERLREQATEIKSNINSGKKNKKHTRVVHDAFFKYQIIEEFCNGKSVAEIMIEFKLESATVYSWLRNFAEKGYLGKKVLSEEETLKIEKLRTQLLQQRNQIKNYETSFKYQVIEEFCNAKKIKDVIDVYQVASSTIYNWLRSFVRNGKLDYAVLTYEETLKLEKLRELATKREEEIQDTIRYDTSFKFQLIKEFCEGKTTSAIYEQYDIHKRTMMRWLQCFIQDGTLDGAMFSSEEAVNMKKLREKANEKYPHQFRYDAAFRYQMIEEFCNGKSYHAINNEFGVDSSTVFRWVKNFIKNGAFDKTVLSPEEKLRIEQLREKAEKIKSSKGKNRTEQRSRNHVAKHHLNIK